MILASEAVLKPGSGYGAALKRIAGLPLSIREASDEQPHREPGKKNDGETEQCCHRALC
jgi:hypothetical protein